MRQQGSASPSRATLLFSFALLASLSPSTAAQSSTTKPFAGLSFLVQGQNAGGVPEAAKEAVTPGGPLIPSGSNGAEGGKTAGQGLEDAFENLASREGKGWMVSEELPEGSGGGRFLDFWRLRANDMEELITPKGYPVQRHKTLTKDGFILTNFRIPYGRKGPDGPKMPSRGAERQPVLLFHGITLSSTCWVINDADQSLAFILADQGYDVWMINSRGNTFSREHEKYADTNPRFWQFALDEFALSDLPATLKYIRKTTGAKEVHVIGHSQGATAGLAYLADQPEAAEGIGALIAVAPVIYAKFIESPTLVAFSYQANEYVFVSGPMQAVFLGGFCQIPGLVPICTATTESMFGSSKFINTAQYQKYWKVWPSPTSYYNALHWGQVFNEPNPVFMKFNYGPEYDLTKIKAPVVLFRGGKDVLSTPEDTDRIRQKLAEGGSLAGVHETEDYGHMDYIWHPGSSRQIYSIILQALARHTRRQ